MMRSSFLNIIGVIGLVFLMGSAHVPAVTWIQPDEVRPTTVEDLKPHPRASDRYNEIWTYYVLLDDNVQLVLNFSRANMAGIRDPACGADLSVIGFHEEPYFVARQFPVENFVFEESNHRLKVSDTIFFEGRLPETHRIRFKTRKNDVSYHIDLQFSDIEQGLTLNEGTYTMGEEELGLFIHIPYANVQGVVAINDEIKRVSGTAYMDHTFMTTFAPKVVNGGYRYVHHGPSSLAVGYVMQPKSEYGHAVIGYGLRRQAGNIVLQRPTHVQIGPTSRARGVRVPHETTITFADQSQVQLNRQADRQQVSSLEELSSLLRPLARRFLGGEILYFRGRGHLDSATPMYYNFFQIK